MKLTRLALKTKDGNFRLFTDTIDGLIIKDILHGLFGDCEMITDAMLVIQHGIDYSVIHCTFSNDLWGDKRIVTELWTLPVDDTTFAEIASKYIGWLMCMIGVDGESLCTATCGDKRQYYFTGKD